jgi:hypothetical protein
MSMRPTEHEPGGRDARHPEREPSAGERHLAESRAALAELLAGEDYEPDTFPRSQTMRFLMGGKGRMVALGAFAGLVAVKPKLAVSLLRFMPLGKLLPVARILQSLR